jgi:hypothetical protein
MCGLHQEGIDVTLTCSLLIVLAVSTGSTGSEMRTVPVLGVQAHTITDAIKTLPVRTPAPASSSSETWMFDRAERRPAALPVMYAALAGLNALDAYSTRRAVGMGAHEVNPLMKKAARSSGQMLAVKALSTASTIYFSERAWKKNRKGAVILMAIVNGTMAAITARNLRNARR